VKFKSANSLLIIDVLVILLILCINFVPITPVRIILGLPFLLFFPGYTLMVALFPRKDERDVIELIALSFGMSIAITALIGLGLNYTSWGIRLLPVLYSISIFVIGMSIVAMFRRSRLKQPAFTSEITIRFPGWGGSRLDKTLSILLAISILGAVGVLAYTVAFPKVGEKFTEFYILGRGGMAQDYPAQFALNNGKVSSVTYSSNVTVSNSGGGQITLGVVNHEQQKTSYRIAVSIDGQSINVLYNGSSISSIQPIELDNDGKWEQLIQFAPLHTGDNQKVEFLLYKDGSAEAYQSLHIWINVNG